MCADADQRGCALANAAIELPEKDHPARRVIEQFKTEQRDRLVALCGAAGIAEPELLADELFLLLEGARVSAQSFGPQGPASRLVRMGEALIASHLALLRFEGALSPVIPRPLKAARNTGTAR